MVPLAVIPEYERKWTFSFVYPESIIRFRIRHIMDSGYTNADKPRSYSGMTARAKFMPGKTKIGVLYMNSKEKYNEFKYTGLNN